MLALITLTSGEVASLEFGDPVEPPRTTEAWLRDLLPDYDVRRPELRESTRRDVLPVIVRLIHEEPDESPILDALIRAAGFLGSPSAAKAVESCLQHPDAGIKRSVIEALGRIGTWSSAEMIRPFLRSQDIALRRAAIVAMGGVGRSGEISNIQSAGVGDLAKPARESAARIRAIQSEDFDAYVDVLLRSDDSENLFPLLIFFWERIARSVLNLDQGETERMKAVRLISHGCLRRAGPALTWVLSRGEEETLEMRVEAALGLGRCHSRQSAPLLVEHLRSGENRLVDAAIVSLGKLGVPEAIEPLLAIWNGAGESQRTLIRRAVYRLAEKDGTWFLSNILMPDPDDWRSPETTRPTGHIRFIAETGTLVEGYRPEIVSGLLESPNSGARRDAALLAAFLGGRADADQLQDVSRNEREDDVRAVMQRAAEHLMQPASATSSPIGS